MSRSKTGIDKDQRNETTLPDDSPRPDNADARFDNENYVSGRESWREFPRRSSSWRGSNRNENIRNEDDRLNNRGTGYSQSYGKRTTNDFDNRTNRDYRDVINRDNLEGYTHDYGRVDRRNDAPRNQYGNRDNNRYDNRSGNRYDNRASSREEGYGRHTYDDLTSGRADHEDFQRYRGSERDNYARNDYRTEQRNYDEPYNRQALGGRYDTENEYSSSPYDRGYQTDYGYGGDYGAARDYRNEQRGWTGGRSALRCSEIMTKNVTTCGPETVIRDVADKMEDDNVGSIPVLDNGRIVGLITDRDIVCRVIAEGIDSRIAKARDIMSEDIVTCTPDEAVIDAIRKMGEHQIRRIPVCDPNGRLRGIISLGDIALEAERDQDLANAIEQISQPTPQQSRRV